MKKSAYILVLLSLALAGVVQASVVPSVRKEQDKVGVEVGMPVVPTLDPLDPDSDDDRAVSADVFVSETSDNDEAEDTADVGVKVSLESEGATDEKDKDLEENDDAPIVIRASEVRDWSPEKKGEILGVSLTRTEVTSEEDLSRFAAAMVLNDENISSVEIDNEEIGVVYAFPAKLFGIFKTNIRAHVTVAARGEERVNVRFPWLSFLYSITTDVKEEALTEAIDTQLTKQAAVEGRAEAALKAEMLDVTLAKLRVKHDTAMSSIRNIK